jgi:hypothetical protein
MTPKSHPSADPFSGPAILLAPPATTTEKMPLDVLIMYEDVTAARRAVRAVARLAERLEDQVEFCRNFWRFDLLAEPACRAAAIQDALRADVVIVATRAAREFPPLVSRWLEGCLAHREKRAIAVLALLGSDDTWSISLEDERGSRRIRETETPRRLRPAVPGHLLPAGV